MPLQYIESAIKKNISIHNRSANSYERHHGEIYNHVEQKRLKKALKLALTHIETTNYPLVALDFGCGAGNLTAHLSDLGCNVIACDVAQGFLDLVGARSYKTDIKTVRLNGNDLSNISNDSVDMVATYSVLHHVPDYLNIIKELIRVLKVGGVLYIDHERSKQFWTDRTVYKKFDKEMRAKSKIDWGKYSVATNYVDWFIRRFVDHRYRRFGDIHVFSDDHIDWEKIAGILLQESCRIIFEKDYLLCKKNYDIFTYNQYKESLFDTHLVCAKKY